MLACMLNDEMIGDQLISIFNLNLWNEFGSMLFLSKHEKIQSKHEKKCSWLALRKCKVHEFKNSDGQNSSFHQIK